MIDSSAQPTPDRSILRESYTPGYDEWTQEWMRERTAQSHAFFFVPYLSRGNTLLDCGCGPGSITLDLAHFLRDGQVIGIDIEPNQIEAARAEQAQQGLTNVSFEVADAYNLPFPDGSFDAVFAHALLMHLREPLVAMREMRRVLKPGGVVGISDPDFGTVLCAPSSPLLDEVNLLLVKMLEHNGASPYYARNLRSLLLQAGFERSEASAYCIHYGKNEVMKEPAWILEHYLTAPTFVAAAVETGCADNARLDQMTREVRSWSERPDAFYALMFCTAVGWR